MISFIIQKMKKNKWSVICLLLGCILVVGMFAAIPIYTKGILQRMLIKQLDNKQTTDEIYSGYLAYDREYQYTTNTTDSDRARYRGTFSSIEDIRAEAQNVCSELPYTPESVIEEITLSKLFYYRGTNDGEKVEAVTANAMTGFADKVTLVSGRMYEASSDPTVVEVVVSQQAMALKGFSVGQEIQIMTNLYSDSEVDAMKIKIVGVVEATDPSDPYWYVSMDTFRTGFIMDYATLYNESYESLPRNVTSFVSCSIFDYSKFEFGDAKTVLSAWSQSEKWIKDTDSTIGSFCSFSDVFQDYPSYQKSLETSLWVLFVPIILMLAFYIYMVSQLVVTTDRSVISVMESRGAGRIRIMLMYLYENGFLAASALILGPLLGLLMCKILGASNGFLSFINRKALPVELSVRVYIYAICAIVFFIIVTLIPVFVFARKGIVDTKKSMAGRGKKSAWQKFYVDFILLGLAAYTYKSIQTQLADKSSFASKNDSLLFLASTLFVLGAGMLFLRLYPLLIKAVFLLGRKRWSPVMFTSFLQVSRTDGREQFLMLFIIFALSVGIFNANAARTINQNAEDEVSETIGADLVVQEEWLEYDDNGNQISLSNPTLDITSATVIKYKELSMDRFTSIAGVKHATRVLRTNETNTIEAAGGRLTDINIMAIDPYDFGMISWTRSDVLPHQLNEYLNAMIENPTLAVLSTSTAEKLQVEAGDSVTLRVDRGRDINMTVLAIVDYWPGVSATYVSEDGDLVKNNFIIMDFSYYLSKSPMLPYEVWIDKEDGTTDSSIYEGIAEQNISVESIVSSTQEISTIKNDPQLQGLNGALTLGFIVSMVICAIGFLIYWIISIQGRVLQFGIYRAMGMSKYSILGIIGAEQVLISGAAIGIGIVIGDVASKLYLPLFKLLNQSDGTSLPYEIITNPSDYVKIYLILGAVLLVCFAILARIMLHIQIDQAVKLGEE